MREDERAEGQHDGDVEVAGGRVERELVMLAERQRHQTQQVTDEDEEEDAADVREPVAAPLFIVDRTIPSLARPYMSSMAPGSAPAAP